MADAETNRPLVLSIKRSNVCMFLGVFIADVSSMKLFSVISTFKTPESCAKIRRVVASKRVYLLNFEQTS